MMNIAYPTIIQTSKLLLNINTSPYVFEHKIIRTTVNLSKSLKRVNENSRKICSLQQLNIQNLHKYKENRYGSYSRKPYNLSKHNQFNILHNCPNIKRNPLGLEFHTTINKTSTIFKEVDHNWYFKYHFIYFLKCIPNILSYQTPNFDSMSYAWSN